MNRYFYHHRQAWRSSVDTLLKTPLATVMTCVALAVILALPTGLFVALNNVQQIGHDFQKNMGLTLYLKEKISAEAIKSLVHRIQQKASVQSVHYMTPQDGLNDFQMRFHLEGLNNLFETAPFPAVVEVFLMPKAYSHAMLNILKQQFQKLPGVDAVRLDWKWLERWFSMLNFIQQFVELLSAFFGLAVLLMIGNTTRLTIQRHRQDILVMQLMGASSSFITRPYVYMGIFFCLFGAALGYVLVVLGMRWLDEPLQSLARLYDLRVRWHLLTMPQTGVLFIASLSIGYLGAYFSVRAALKSLL